MDRILRGRPGLKFALVEFPPKLRTKMKRKRNHESSGLSSRSLSKDQYRVYKLAKAGKSVFFTGPAGTGKSYLIHFLVTKAFKNKHVSVTATTGRAAVDIQGKTVHSFFGIGQGKGEPEQWAAGLSKYTRANLKKTDVLIVDEISMMPGELLDKLNVLAQTVRHSADPFGGTQMIVSGDFMQLPPVVKGAPMTFAFEAQVWKQLFPQTVMLRHGCTAR